MILSMISYFWLWSVCCIIRFRSVAVITLRLNREGFTYTLCAYSIMLSIWLEYTLVLLSREGV
jgi:hypothetical protein